MRGKKDVNEVMEDRSGGGENEKRGRRELNKNLKNKQINRRMQRLE